MIGLARKTLLILGGAYVHCKLVKAAKDMGIYTIVTDYLDPKDSPAKVIADEHWEIDIFDVDGIVSKCREKHVDGVISGWLDPCQRPYCDICEELGLPCYGTREQFFKLTDKCAFKKMCVENGVDIIPEYTEKDVERGNVEYPVFVKPSDSRGSRGQTVCFGSGELAQAVSLSRLEASDNSYIIEKYLDNKVQIQITWFFVDGKPHLLRATDCYQGRLEEKLEKLTVFGISPSFYIDEFLKETNDKLIKMFKNLGLNNGPVFMQCFYDDGVFRFYDPGFRFPGAEYELAIKEFMGVDLMKFMVCFALSGKMPDEKIDDKIALLNGRRAAVLFPTISAGTISGISGVEEIKASDDVYAMWLRYSVGKKLGWTYDINQRLAEIGLFSNSVEEIKKDVLDIQRKLVVMDEHGNNMIYRPFDVDRIKF